MTAILLAVFKKSNSKEKRVLFAEDKLARQNKLNCSFVLIKSKLNSHSLQLWWQLLHLIDRNIAFKQLTKNSRLRSWFPGHHLRPPKCHAFWWNRDTIYYGSSQDAEFLSKSLCPRVGEAVETLNSAPLLTWNQGVPRCFFLLAISCTNQYA